MTGSVTTWAIGLTNEFKIPNTIATTASVTSDAGALSAVAGHDLSITSGTSADQVDERHRHKEKGFLSSKTRTTRDTLDSTTALASTFSGETTDLVAGRDIGVKGSNVVSTNETALTAGRNLAIESATENHAETHFKKTKQSGVFGSGGVGSSQHLFGVMLMAATNIDALVRKKGCHHPASRERVVQMKLVDPPHDRQIDGRHRLRHVVDAAAADPESLRLF